MTEQDVRKIAQDEIRRANTTSRFGVTDNSFHTHNGVDSPKLNANNILPSVSVSGSMTFSSAAVYTLKINALFTPSNIFCTGNVIGSGTERYTFVGTAQLGPSFYFQPQDNRTVVTGKIQYPFQDPNNPSFGTNIPMQSSSYYGSESEGGARHTLVGNFHIIDIQYPVGTVHARATITDFSRTSITVTVETLESGWRINANFVVT